MNRSLKAKLSTMSVVIFAVVLIVLIVMFGQNISATFGAIILEILFALYFSPKIIKEYYLLHDVQPPSVISRCIPFVNLTKIVSPVIAWLSILIVALIGLSFLGLYGLRFQNFLTESQLFRMFDILPSIVFVGAFLYFIVIGLGLTGLFLKINKEHKQFFRDMETDKEVSGFVKVVGALFDGSTFLLAVIFMLPVFRVAPMISLVSKTHELYFLGKRL